MKAIVQNSNPEEATPFKTAADLVARSVDALTGMGRKAGAAILEHELSQLGDQPYKIAVVGAFKTGKSTLINAAFLGKEVLFSDLLEATCVPTELAWGSRPLLKVFPYLEDFEESAGSDHPMAIRVGEEAAVEISDPTPNDIRTETSSPTAQEREFKAKRISRVRLETPLEALKGLTVVDSPGIDSTSGAVVDAALRIVPGCDAVLFVTRGGQLSTAEVEFLKSGVLDQGISRGLVVLNHYDNMTPLNAEGRKKHVEALRATLAPMGRGHMPIVSVDARAWLDAITSGKPLADDAVAFQRELQRFVKGDLGNARLEKAVLVTRRELRGGLVELAAAAALENKSREEREKLSGEINRRSAEASGRLGMLGEDFMCGLRNSLRTFRSSVNRGVSDTVENFKERLRAAVEIEDLQKELDGVQKRLRPAIESRCLDAVQTLRRDLQGAEQHFNREARSILSNIDADKLIPSIGAGVALPPIPAPLVTVLDYILVIIASPLPMVFDIILRLFVNRFPEIRKMLPTGLVKTMAQNWAEKALDKQVAAAAAELENKLTEIEHQTDAAVKKGIVTLVENEVKPIREALRKVETRQAPWPVAEIMSHKEALERLHSESQTLFR
jgi:hypothetical protein